MVTIEIYSHYFVIYMMVLVQNLANMNYFLYLCRQIQTNKDMKITIINNERNEKRYTREELDEFVAQLKDGTFRHHYVRDYNKEVCFAAEWVKQSSELKTKSINALVLLSLENLRDLATVQEYKRLATQLPYTLLCFLGHDGHSLRIVCPYAVSEGEPSGTTLLNAFHKLHYIYSSQLGTPLTETEPTFSSCCMTKCLRLYA